MKLYSLRKYETDIQVLEFNPAIENLILTCTGNNNRTILSKLQHLWFKARGYTLVAKWNWSLFNYVKGGKADTCGLDYRDRGISKGDTTQSDVFMEVIWLANKLLVDDITLSKLKMKYPNTDWATSVPYTLLIDGKIDIRKAQNFNHSKYPNPRTMMGQRLDGTVVVVVTDGRTKSDRGLTALEQATIMKELECNVAVNADGGGSSELIVLNPETKQYEIKNTLSGGERAIANALLLYAKGSYQIMNKNKRRVVCLDAGHGMNTMGKRTPKFQDNTIIHEAEQNYPIMELVKKHLKSNNIDVICTNESIEYDMSLSKRVSIEKKKRPDLFLSIHKNASKGVWQTYAKGIETFVHKKGFEAEKIGKLVQKHLIADTNMKDRGVTEGYKYINGKPIYVLKSTYSPAILVELGFMDYLPEAKQMKDSHWHELYAKAIVKGICEYFSIQPTFSDDNKNNKNYDKLLNQYQELKEKYNDVKEKLSKITQEM